MASSTSRERATSPGEISQTTKEERPRLPGQGQWIKSEPAWKSWTRNDNESSPVLWIHGPSGCGKTFLMRHIVEDFPKMDEQPAIVSCFCDAYSSPESIFWSILNQLAREPKLGTEAQSVIKEGLKYVHEEATVFKIWDSFSSVATMALDINFIIDGLDEVSYQQDFNVAARLIEAISQMKGRVKLLITSTSESSIRNYFRDCLDILITTEKVEEDMKSFIGSELQLYENTEPFRDEIVSKVLRLSDGNFLWAGLCIKNLALATNGDRLAQIDRFPSSLDGAYAMTFQQNAELLKRPDLELRNHVLRWAVVAVRPFQLAELANSAAVDTNSFISDIESKTAKVCGSLIKVENGVLKAVHNSLREFLSGQHTGLENIVNVRSEQASADIARICLMYLSHPAFRNFLDETFDIESAVSYPFLEYATLYLVHHISIAERSSPDLQAMIKDFFASSDAFVWLDVFLPAYLLRSVIPPPPGRTPKSARFFYLFILKSRLVNYFSDQLKSDFDEQISDFLRKSYEDALLRARSKYGSESIPAVQRMMDLAEVYGWLPGLKPEVQPLLEEALSITSKFEYDEGNGLMMDIQQALADDFKRGGKYKEAQELLETLMIATDKLNESNPRVMIALDSLGWICMRLNQLPESVSYLERSLKIASNDYGSQSPQTLRTKMTLAEVLNKLDRSEEAEALYAELISQVKHHKENDSQLPKNSISQLNTLAAIYVQQGKWRDACATYSIVVEDRKDAFGEDHPLTMWATMQLGNAMKEAGESNQSKNLFEALVPRQKKILGEGHPDVKESEEQLEELRTLTK